MNLPHHRNLITLKLPLPNWETIKWIGNISLLVGTIAMISPKVAAEAITPWTLYLIGNLIWLIDSIRIKSMPWIYIASFLAAWDVLVIISRVTGLHVFRIFDPFVHFLNILP